MLHEFQLAAMVLDLSFQSDQFAQRGTGKELDGREIQQQLLALLLFDQIEQFLAQALDVGLVQNLAVHESHYRCCRLLLRLPGACTWPSLRLPIAIGRRFKADRWINHPARAPTRA